ncbi:MAG: hypothetical protein QF473_40510, partial [Planctomycetota bacterium]|nr:hypothetical protein [Planctomycetota bacterium]
MKKLFLFLFGVTYALLIAAGVLGYMNRQKLAYKVLSVESEDVNEDTVLELRDAADKWSSQQRIDADAAAAKARRDGTEYTPERYEFELSSAVIESFPPEKLATTISKMRPDTIARVLPRITNEATRQLVRHKLASEKLGQVDDWIALSRDKASLVEEKNALRQQKRRMELFQSSLDRQFQDLRLLQVSIREEMKDIQAIQDSMQEQLVEVDANERTNLAKLARTFSEMRPEDVAAMVENVEDGFDEQKFTKVLFMMDDDARGKVL